MGFFDSAEKGECIDCGKVTKRREPGLSGTGIDSVFYCAKCKKKNNPKYKDWTYSEKP